MCRRNSSYISLQNSQCPILPARQSDEMYKQKGTNFLDMCTYLRCVFVENSVITKIIKQIKFVVSNFVSKYKQQKKKPKKVLNTPKVMCIQEIF